MDAVAGRWRCRRCPEAAVEDRVAQVGGGLRELRRLTCTQCRAIGHYEPIRKPGKFPAKSQEGWFSLETDERPK